MTISKHVILLKTGIVVSFLAFAAFAASAWYVFPFYPDLIDYEQAPRNIPAFMSSILPPPEPYTAFVATGLSVLFALVSQILLFYFFEKTQSTEIRFLSIFLFSFTFEILRIQYPLKEALQLSGYIPAITARLLIFGRLYGTFALFVAGLYACGFKMRREENIIFPMVMIALLLAFRAPFDMFRYDTNICPVMVFSHMFRVASAAIVLLSMYCFISGAYTRNNQEYYLIAPGILAAAVGRFLLFTADTWLMLFPAFAILLFGTWFAGSQLRRMYLWA
ncbi:MAG: hypothetical protein LBH18_02175 [Spirochaetaceae bacterium]|jgi:hypothetical protein|nr:hypothetical protein [Spirochaetaceae bacterium]